MFKLPKRQSRKTTQKTVAVIKNCLTEAEMKTSGDSWAEHQGPYLTIADVLAIEQEKSAVAQ